MSLTTLNAISPIDGRYRKATKPLAEFFSEEALIKYDYDYVFYSAEYTIYNAKVSILKKSPKNCQINTDCNFKNSAVNTHFKIHSLAKNKTNSITKNKGTKDEKYTFTSCLKASSVDSEASLGI